MPFNVEAGVYYFYPRSPSMKSLKKRGDLAGGNLLDLRMQNQFNITCKVYNRQRVEDEEIRYLPKMRESGRRTSVETR